MQHSEERLSFCIDSLLNDFIFFSWFSLFFWPFLRLFWSLSLLSFWGHLYFSGYFWCCVCVIFHLNVNIKWSTVYELTKAEGEVFCTCPIGIKKSYTWYTSWVWPFFIIPYIIVINFITYKVFTITYGCYT